MTNSEKTNTNKKTIKLEDVKINVKLKLSALWVTLMFFYAYRDIIGFMEPGHLEQFMAGEIEGIVITQALLMVSVIIQAIPSVMVFLSLILKAKANRWANVILGLVYIVVLVGFSTVGEITFLYLFYAIAEAFLLALIVWYAWKWPKLEA
jgi:heme A synthase